MQALGSVLPLAPGVQCVAAGPREAGRGSPEPMPAGVRHEASPEPLTDPTDGLEARLRALEAHVLQLKPGGRRHRVALEGSWGGKVSAASKREDEGLVLGAGSWA